MVQRDYRAYAVVYLIAGSGFYGDVHIGRVVLAAGDMLVLFPGLAHDYGPLVPGAWDEGWVAMP